MSHVGCHRALRALEPRGGLRRAAREPLDELVQVVAAQPGRQPLIRHPTARPLREFGDPVDQDTLDEPCDVAGDRDRGRQIRIRGVVEEMRIAHPVERFGHLRPQVGERLDGAFHTLILPRASDIPPQIRGTKSVDSRIRFGSFRDSGPRL